MTEGEKILLIVWFIFFILAIREMTHDFVIFLLFVTGLAILIY